MIPSDKTKRLERIAADRQGLFMRSLDSWGRKIWERMLRIGWIGESSLESAKNRGEALGTMSAEHKVRLQMMESHTLDEKGEAIAAWEQLMAKQASEEDFSASNVDFILNLTARQKSLYRAFMSAVKRAFAERMKDFVRSRLTAAGSRYREGLRSYGSGEDRAWFRVMLATTVSGGKRAVAAWRKIVAKDEDR